MIKKLSLLSILFPITCFSTPSIEVLFNTNPSVVKVHVANDKGNYEKTNYDYSGVDHDDSLLDNEKK